MELEPVLGFKIGVEYLGGVLVRFPVLVLNLDSILYGFNPVGVISFLAWACSYKYVPQLFWQLHSVPVLYDGVPHYPVKCPDDFLELLRRKGTVFGVFINELLMNFFVGKIMLLRSIPGSIQVWFIIGFDHSFYINNLLKNCKSLKLNF